MDCFLSFVLFFNLFFITNSQPVKTVLATEEYELCHYATLYLLPQIENQEIANNECGDSGKEMFSDTMFQIHHATVPIHGDSSFPVLEAETEFNNKWNYFVQKKERATDISDLTYDPFFDYSWAFWKHDLEANLKVVQDQDDSGLDYVIPYQILQWSLDEPIHGKQNFISLIEYIPTTQTIYELIAEYDSSKYDSLLENELIFETEPRMSFKGYLGHTLPWNEKCLVPAIKQSRAVSDLDVNVAWYVEYMNAQLVKFKKLFSFQIF